MAGRVAVVTGGTRGIGAAVSRMLKDKGYKVAATYAGNDDAAKKFKAQTGIAVYKFDVSDNDAVNTAVAQIEKDLGPIEIVVRPSLPATTRITSESHLSSSESGLKSLCSPATPTS